MIQMSGPVHRVQASRYVLGLHVYYSYPDSFSVLEVRVKTESLLGVFPEESVWWCFFFKS